MSIWGKMKVGMVFLVCVVFSSPALGNIDNYRNSLAAECAFDKRCNLGGGNCNEVSISGQLAIWSLPVNFFKEGTTEVSGYGYDWSQNKAVLMLGGVQYDGIAGPVGHKVSTVPEIHDDETLFVSRKAGFSYMKLAIDSSGKADLRLAEGKSGYRERLSGLYHLQLVNDEG